MEANPLQFTATGVIYPAPGQAAGVGLGSGVTSIDLYDGAATTDPFVARVTATTAFAVPLIFKTSVYAVLTGTGKASLWVR